MGADIIRGIRTGDAIAAIKIEQKNCFSKKKKNGNVFLI